MSKFQLILSGIVRNNPTFVLVLGMCPTLGTTTSAVNGMGMGLATMAVLILSNIVISLIKNLIPDKVRIPAFIVVIASFVTIIQMLMQAFVPVLYAALGVAILMIQKEFDLLQSVTYSVATALGFGLALVLFAGIRERLEFEDVPEAFRGVPVALITAGILAMAFMGFSGLV